MPVADTTPHALTVRSGSEPWGCHNRHIQPSYSAPVRNIDGAGKFVALEACEIEHTMSKECRHSSSLTDPRCAGCKWQGFGEAYVQSVLIASGAQQ